MRYDEEARDCLCGHPSCLRTLGTKRGEGEESGGGVNGGGGGGCGGCGSGDGAGAFGGKGRSRKATLKWEDPETGEVIRPWLHLEDAEVRVSF